MLVRSKVGPESMNTEEAKCNDVSPKRETLKKGNSEPKFRCNLTDFGGQTQAQPTIGHLSPSEANDKGSTASIRDRLGSTPVGRQGSYQRKQTLLVNNSNSIATRRNSAVKVDKVCSISAFLLIY